MVLACRRSVQPGFAPVECCEQLDRSGAGLAISTARLLSVGHRLDIATVVQLCEVVHHGGQFCVHFRVSLDSSSDVMSSSGSMIVTFLLWSSPARETRSASCRALPGVVVTCSATMFVGRPVFCHVSVLHHCA